MAKPKVGLALGSGGARGFSHLGVIKVLEEHNIPIDVIAGSSMGALIGTLYGAGQSVPHLYKLAKYFKRKYFLDITVPKMGFIQGNKIQEYIKIFTYGKKYEDFSIPVAVVATDLQTGKRIVFQEGDPSVAVRASISIPGIFVPVPYQDKLLVDGGVLDRVPVSTVRDMGADIVIGVDCSHYKAYGNITSIFDVLMQSFDIMQDEIIKNTVMDADFLLRPDVSRFSSKAFTNIDDIIEEGEQETIKNIDMIKDAVFNWKEN